MKVKPATLQDSKDIWQWRNDPASRAMFFDGDQVAWEDHQQWYARALKSPERTLLVGVDEEVQQNIGVVRFDGLEDEVVEVSINLNPLYRGQGLAKPLLSMAIDHYLAINNCSQLIAKIKSINTASRKLFAGVGFEFVSDSEGCLEYQRLVTTKRSDD